MSAVAVRTVILWIHAIGGAAWIGACVSFLLAGGAMGLETEEGRGFARRVGPVINRIGLGAAALIVLTGMLNFALAGAQRNFHFSRAFAAILSAKIAILILMLVLLIASLRVEPGLAGEDSAAFARAIRRILFYDGAIAACAAVAMILGLWLLGS